MTKTTIEALRGLAASWRKDAAAMRGEREEYGFNECADELEAALAALSQGEGRAELEPEFASKLKSEAAACSRVDIINAAIWARQVSEQPSVPAGIRKAAKGVASNLEKAEKLYESTHHPEAQQPEAVAWWEVTAKPIWDESEPPETFVVPGPNKPTDGKTPGLELVSVRPLIYGDTTPLTPATPQGGE